jgi:phycocyanin-associated rod linker protein
MPGCNRVEVAGLAGPGYPKVRRVTTSFLVPYDQLLQRMQQIHRQGGRIAGITPA